MPQPHRPLLGVEISRDGVVTTATVSGELGINSAQRLIEALAEITRMAPERLVLDLSGVVFLDVTGARAIAALDKALRPQCAVIIRGMRPSARRVFALTGQLAPERLAQPPAGLDGFPSR